MHLSVADGLLICLVDGKWMSVVCKQQNGGVKTDFIFKHDYLLCFLEVGFLVNDLGT